MLTDQHCGSFFNLQDDSAKKIRAGSAAERRNSHKKPHVVAIHCWQGTRYGVRTQGEGVRKNTSFTARGRLRCSRVEDEWLTLWRTLNKGTLKNALEVF
ncbi:hypothetical protein LJN55_23465 (plasmid) [Erwinia rhapontici]|uniref:hypothetical protein n=1 Tax=Erwinia rhapontici TaxID=55212 RepID=UPI001D0DB120|nr:hypothetical protein [Erwinia rhapontici]UDQ82768.1 hypothetical protein LJN55_23465 [Erwinia rhapontici]